jgi:ribosomal protein L11 methyltransferase
MPWIQLKIDTSASKAEAIGDALTEHGALAVTFVDGKDTPMYEPKPGEVMLWPDTTVIGLFEADADVNTIAATMLAQRQLGNESPWRADPLEDKDWEREWMDNFHPMQFGKRLWVCPSWRDIPDPNAVNVMLDPGLAFGTGTHPTTSLCLKWLDGESLDNRTFVDFGIGIDIDPQALQASMENARRNQVEQKLEVFLPANQPLLQADYVFANILSGPLIQLREVITGYCKQGGKLVLSGILAEQIPAIEQAYGQDFDLEPSAIDGEWARVSGTRK